jgi:hypothetical protein
LQGLFKLDSAAAHVTRHGLERYARVNLDQATGLGDRLIIDQDLASQNHATADVAAVDKTAIDEQEI